MNTTTKKIIGWIAGALLAAGVIGTTTYKFVTGEETAASAAKQVAVSVQQYASDAISTSVKKVDDVKAAPAATEVKVEIPATK